MDIFDRNCFPSKDDFEALEKKYITLQEKYERLRNHTEMLNETITSYEMKLKERSRKIDSAENNWSERYYQLLKENIELLKEKQERLKEGD